MAKNSMIPRIRFKGFTDAWEQRKLGDAFDMTVKNNTLSRADLYYDGGNVQSIHYGDILIKYGAFVDSAKDAVPYIRNGRSEDYRSQFLKEGDIIFADTAEDETVGKATEIADLRGKNVVSGLHTIVCRPYDRKAKYYLGYYFNSPSFHDQLIPLMQGIKVLSLSRNNLAKTDILYPLSKAEQTVIGQLFAHIDNLITLHQRKYEKFVNIKKALLEKMFPQGDEKVPRIRFKGFTDAWEQCKLGDIFVRIVRKNTNNESSLPLTISAQDGLVDQITYFNNRVASRDVSNYYLVLNGEFAYNKSTSDGYPFGAVKRLDLYEKGVLSTLYIVFALKDASKTDSDYIAVFFDTDRWHRGVAERAAEGARNHGLLNISADDFFDIGLLLPGNIDEQRKIGQILKRIDSLITLHQRQVEKLKNIKSALLEKMFV